MPGQGRVRARLREGARPRPGDRGVPGPSRARLHAQYGARGPPAAEAVRAPIPDPVAHVGHRARA
eukprot:5087471-Alexandrium_andersonii.AAC.1